MGVVETVRSVVQFKPLELDPVQRRIAKAASVGDLRRMARRRLPRGVFDYIDGGAEDERSLARNVSAFGRLELNPRVLRDVSAVDTSTTILGRPAAMPLALSPTGFTRIADPQGELAVARAANRAGLPYGLSTMGTRSIEEVAAVSSGAKWFQVYTWKDRGLVKDLVDRAAAAGYEAIILTVDTAVLGRRERDVRRGYTLPPKIGPGTIVDGILHPAWTLDFLRNPPITFASVASNNPADDGSSAVTLSEYMNSQFDAALSWRDVEWLQSVWSGPLVLKGIQSPADAKLAVAAGVQAIALSNHGGRQLDDAPPVVELIEPVAQEVGGQIEIYCDGGVRRGSDIVKAVALGANACMIGRAYLYALGAAGERGVDHVLGFLAQGMARTMALAGAPGVADINRELVRWRPPSG
ncbi:MAG: alpha-hydroxy-acid oxidizing protein [Acidimicrobiia bacterium]|nr:alpha-hydroxy-acid oxidizing protein [Acidimicrobiia bacterium]MDH4362636.1 alpha-hydroxy-acid oxidizing protein [Acidimicrobiia bacterium]MDH5290191.1 alpha-hydroxy-acid oxidizing protein [Acidimicrobiia bacterium]